MVIELWRELILFKLAVPDVSHAASPQKYIEANTAKEEKYCENPVSSCSKVA